MALSITVGSLVTQAKTLADFTNDTSISDTEWKAFANILFGQLHKKFVKAGLRQYETVQSVSSASLTDNSDGGGLVALPAGYYGTLGVDRVETDSTQCSLYELMPQERTRFAGITGASEAVAYAVVGVNLVLYPKPPGGQTYRHIYAPQPVDISAAADGTSIDVVNIDGLDYMLWGMARLALHRERSDASMATGEWQRASDALDEAAQLRSLLNMIRRTVEPVWPDDAPYDPADYRWY